MRAVGRKPESRARSTTWIVGSLILPMTSRNEAKTTPDRPTGSAFFRSAENARKKHKRNLLTLKCQPFLTIELNNFCTFIFGCLCYGVFLSVFIL